MYPLEQGLRLLLRLCDELSTGAVNVSIRTRIETVAGGYPAKNQTAAVNVSIRTRIETFHMFLF